MIDPTFRRLVWKEYRLQRAFWISMVVLAGLFFAAVLVLTRERNLAFRTTWLFDVALALSTLYALGCGATLFAAEHEADTYDFQRALPVSGLRLFLSKATFGVASTAAMIGLLWGLAAMLAGGQLPEAQMHREMWALWGFGAAEALVWGTFFSLLLRRPLTAALVAGAVGSMITILAVPLVMGRVWRYQNDPYLYSVPYQAAFLGLVALATVWLGHRWFREKIVLSRPYGSRPLGKLTDESKAALG
ncbi:MAG: hypothetical protein HQ582_30810, partial [Planctomycetes bacterium]|nr:hypothetical protein [Planctomycetota bacterium]